MVDFYVTLAELILLKRAGNKGWYMKILHIW